jgi:RNA polymerase sigma factor (sigma-70 family)
VARAQAGDRSALEALVGRHQAWIYNIAVRMLGHPQDAEDATQGILIKALTRLSSFEGRSRFRTWLYRIAVNHGLNTKRGRLEPETLTFDAPTSSASIPAWAREHRRARPRRMADRPCLPPSCA